MGAEPPARELFRISHSVDVAGHEMSLIPGPCPSTDVVRRAASVPTRLAVITTSYSISLLLEDASFMKDEARFLETHDCFELGA